MKVLKFGGTSVGNAENIRKVADILKAYQQENQKIAVVVSAMSGVTNQLIEMGTIASRGEKGYIEILKTIEGLHFDTIRNLMDVSLQSKSLAHVKLLLNELEDLLKGIFWLKELSKRSLDLLQSFGERLSSYIVASFLTQEGVLSAQLDARKVVKTNSEFGAAKVDFEQTNTNIKNYFQEHTALQIITGFIALDEEGVTTTLGRGGSDYTVAIFGAALEAELIEIWTDVNGVMTTDPRVVQNAFSLEQLSYEEAMEMSHFGAKVIYPPTLQPAFEKQIPLKIRNTFQPSFEGTLISSESGKDDWPVKGISSIKDIALLTLSGSSMIGVPGVSSRMTNALSVHEISLILITQASSEHSITFAVAPEDAKEAQLAIEKEFAHEISSGKIDPIKLERNLSVVAIIGENMRHTPGIAAQMFSAIGKNGVNIVAIAQGSSELNVSVVIENKHLSKALNALHETFFLSDIVTLNVHLLGVGLIGGTLLNQIKAQSEYLLAEHRLQIKIASMANSKKMVFDEDGLDISQDKLAILEKGKPSDIHQFIEKVKEMNLVNSVLVDCTSGDTAAKRYDEILNASISITTPNKLANSGALVDYYAYQKAASDRKVKFLYETNVGAGLPVIGPLRDLKICGDRVKKIDGVLSGTLSYIFNNYVEGRTFAEVVKEAKEKGYTEPDPRDDLSGTDVARKILILAREAGYPLEPEDVKVENILPDACAQAPTVEEFLEKLANYEEVFAHKREQAESEGKVLRFVATLENGTAEVSLKAVDKQHPFYSLSGSDNMVVFNTNRYTPEPLVIRGPGAGAEVTAAGVFAEIIAIGNYLTHA